MSEILNGLKTAKPFRWAHDSHTCAAGPGLVERASDTLSNKLVLRAAWLACQPAIACEHTSRRAFHSANGSWTGVARCRQTKASANMASGTIYVA